MSIQKMALILIVALITTMPAWAQQRRMPQDSQRADTSGPLAGVLGAGGPLTFTRDASGLVVNLPEKKPNDYAYALKITPK